MNRLLIKIFEKMNAHPNLTVSAVLYLAMAAASFGGLIYKHGAVLGFFWLAAALFNIVFIAFTR